jgi:alkanesulfonate monooxygenase SsuD/methylene tetrahydromethanopterin reductase-like flavin-dependent oxidoreductase (luciferase family)
MLNLTAKYADLWNTGYLGQPETLETPRQELLEACQESGRDPETLGITAMIALHYPKLAPAPDGFDNPPLSGTPTQVARAMLGFEEAGVEHIMFHLIPYKPEAIRKLEEALRIYRQLSGENKLKKAI